jgi:hypothetical protein
MEGIDHLRPFPPMSDLGSSELFLVLDVEFQDTHRMQNEAGLLDALSGGSGNWLLDCHRMSDPKK